MKRLIWLIFLSAGCGGAVCGNGTVEEGEQCDDGNTAGGDACSPECKALATIDTYIHYSPFIANQFPGFRGDSCSDLGIFWVDIALSGPRSITQRVRCDLIQLKVSSLPDGSYTVTGKAYEQGAGMAYGQGTAISRGLTSTTFTVAGKTQDVNLDWPYEDFTRTYTGTFFFSVLWDRSRTCAGATPPVTRQRLRLERNGVAVPGMVETGEPFDGSATGACVDGGSSLAQFARNVPWGPARFTITGEDSGGTPRFRKSFDTFVGADIVNTVLEFDVASLAPDAGPPDAAPPDGPF